MIDRSRRAASEADRATAAERTALLTPLSKAFATDIGNEVASLGVQVHGGMGFIEETGAAQHYRDIRIAAIYEGTNGIQAIDLVTRKIGLASGEVVKREIADMRATIEKVRATNAPDFGRMGERLTEAVDCFERATQFMFETLAKSPNDALAGATPYLRLFGLARGGASLADLALAARPEGPSQSHHVAIARFFAENICVGARGYELSVTEGATSVHMGRDVLAVH
jgi:alkylation response protein AidB-like acyl-CoA dehydrogenase